MEYKESFVEEKSPFERYGHVRPMLQFIVSEDCTETARLCISGELLVIPPRFIG